MNLQDTISRVIRNADEYDRTGRPRPAWLQKQVRAVYLVETDYRRGLSLLEDGLRDERDCLDSILEKMNG